MPDLTPRIPSQRPLIWSDAVLDLQEQLLDLDLTHPLYMVGGAVRDALMHRPMKDIDIVTAGDVVKLGRKLANALHADIFILGEVESERGVVRLFWEHRDGKLQIDLTPFRGEDLQADLWARDFTMNAMAVDLYGDISRLIDPMNGERDIQVGILRQCTPQALNDDPLRCVRAVRQSVQFGYRIEPETLQAIRANASRLPQVSGERVRDELARILMMDKVSTAFKIAFSLGVLEHILPELMTLKGQTNDNPNGFDLWEQTLYSLDKLSTILTAISPRRTDNTAASFEMGMMVIQLDRYRARLNQHIDYAWANDRQHRALMILGAVLHLLDNRVRLAEHYADVLRLSNPEKKRLTTMLDRYPQLFTINPKDDLAVHRFWYGVEEAGIDAILVGMAGYLGYWGQYLVQAEWLVRVETMIQLLSAYFDRYETVVNPPLWLDGHELMAMGIPQGREIGRLLSLLREAQATQQVANRDEAVAFIHAHR